MQVRVVDIHTGIVRDVIKIVDGSPVVCGKMLYWIKPLPYEVTHFKGEGQTWDEVSGHSELWAVSLMDNHTRCLSADLPALTSLMAGSEGVFWTERHSYPDRQVDL